MIREEKEKKNHEKSVVGMTEWQYCNILCTFCKLCIKKKKES